MNFPVSGPSLDFTILASRTHCQNCFCVVQNWLPSWQRTSAFFFAFFSSRRCFFSSSFLCFLSMAALIMMSCWHSPAVAFVGLEPRCKNPKRETSIAVRQPIQLAETFPTRHSSNDSSRTRIDDSKSLLANKLPIVFGRSSNLNFSVDISSRISALSFNYFPPFLRLSVLLSIWKAGSLRNVSPLIYAWYTREW